MKVSASELNSSVGFMRPKTNLHKQATFTGRIKASKELVDIVTKQTSKFPKLLEYLGKNDGEILNTIVVGIGTAFVAPLFIAFNPFSKEDKETKMYSAWRQPISAILAVAAQIGINWKYNNHLDKNASTGLYDRANLSACPRDSYLKQLIKLEHPEYTKKELKKAIEERKISIRWAAIDKARGELRNKSISYDSLIDSKTLKSAREVLTEEFKKQLKEEFKTELTGKDNKFVEKFLAKKISGPKKKAFAEMLKDKLVPKATEIIKAQMEESAYVKSEVRVWINNANGKTYEALVKEKTAELAKLKSSKAAANTIKKFELVLDKLKGYKSFDNVKKIGNNYAEILQSVKIKQYILAGIDNATAVLSSYRKQTGIVISLLTLPISCGLLNWSYPRIMEKIMPHAGKKHKNCPPTAQNQDRADIRKEVRK